MKKLYFLSIPIISGAYRGYNDYNYKLNEQFLYSKCAGTMIIGSILYLNPFIFLFNEPIKLEIDIRKLEKTDDYYRL